MSYLSCRRPASGRRAGRNVAGWRRRPGGRWRAREHGCIRAERDGDTPAVPQLLSEAWRAEHDTRRSRLFVARPAAARPRYGLDRLGGLLFDRRLFGRTAGSGGGGHVAVSLRSVRLTVQHSPATRSSTRVTLAPARAIKSITPEIPRSRLSAGAVARPSTVTLAPEDVRVRLRPFRRPGRPCGRSGVLSAATIAAPDPAGSADRGFAPLAPSQILRMRRICLLGLGLLGVIAVAVRRGHAPRLSVPAFASRRGRRGRFRRRGACAIFTCPRGRGLDASVGDLAPGGQLAPSITPRSVGSNPADLHVLE